MHSTGVEALDSRLGGVARGGYYLVMGRDGVGKSVLGAHFLATGLDRRERCMLVTSNLPEEIDTRGLFIGFSPGPLSAHPGLDVLDARQAAHELGSGGHRYPVVEAVRRAIQRGPGPVVRLVVDDLNTFLRGTHSTEATARALVAMLADENVTSYIVVSTADSATLDDRILDLLADSANAVIRLEGTGRGRRRLSFESVRQTSFSTDPFLYTIRSGGGFAEDLPAYDREVEAGLRKRVVIMDEMGVVPREVIAALEGTFHVESFTDLNACLSQLLEARYGVLILGTDPYDPERTFDLVYTLRKAGNGAPILFVAHSKGLRSMTRARALRMGGDDFLIAELPPQEIVERITITAQRGHHKRNGSVRPDRPLQPRTEDGSLRPMTPSELTAAINDLISEAPTPFFALAVLEPSGNVPADELWDALRTQIRLSDGDLMSILPDGRLAMVLNQVDLGLSQRVLGRLRRAHHSLATSPRTTVLTSPLQGEELRHWIAEQELGKARA
jgi:KaiC/GvpD/RAD55 family RecA-like ATPase/DNA-binding response OmpR family regulator